MSYLDPDKITVVEMLKLTDPGILRKLSSREDLRGMLSSNGFEIKAAEKESGNECEWIAVKQLDGDIRIVVDPYFAISEIAPRGWVDWIDITATGKFKTFCFEFSACCHSSAYIIPHIAEMEKMILSIPETEASP